MTKVVNLKLLGHLQAGYTCIKSTSLVLFGSRVSEPYCRG